MKLVADALNKGEIARAMITAVLMRLPDPAGAIHAADVHCAVAKAGFNPDEARDERGRWTSGGSDGAYADMDLRQAGTQLADAGMSDVSNDPVAQAAARAEDANTSIVLAAADDEEEKDSRFGIGGNNPPLDELIPRTLIQSPAGPLVQFLDNLLGISEPGDEANLEWAKLQMGALLNKIHEIDPNYVFESIVPEGGLATMSWEGRLNLINGLRADLAAAIYRIQGDIGLLQEVTFAFMQRSANAAYEEAAQLYTAGKLNVRLSREEAIGNYVDTFVRLQLREFFNSLGVSAGTGSAIQVNMRAYDSSGTEITYRIPDARVGNLAFDTSLTAKLPSSPQIRGFFNADFEPAGVVIVRPNQLGNYSSYIIWRQKED